MTTFCEGMVKVPLAATVSPLGETTCQVEE